MKNLLILIGRFLPLIAGWLIVGSLVLLGQAAFAGPAVDRAGIAMSAIKNANVPEARVVEHVTAWAEKAEPRLKGVESCQTIDEEEVCTTTYEVDPWTDEEAAQMWMSDIGMFTFRQTNSRRDRIKDQEQKSTMDAIKAQKVANRLEDL